MTFNHPGWRAIRGAGIALLAAASLVACGGATSQVDTFVPTRMVVFGDEYSALSDSAGTGNSRQYAMNGLDTTDTSNSTVSCADSTRLIWVQRVASHYHLNFSECNPSNLPSSQLKAYMHARYGATELALEEQVNDFQANLSHEQLSGSDLVTMMAGVHDIVAIYLDGLNYGAESQKLVEAEARGRRYAAIANTVMGTGARVLITQVIDVGETPWALAKGSSEAALLTSMSQAFNTGLRLALINDGTKVGLLAVNDTISSLVKHGGYDLLDLACDEDRRETLDESTYAGVIAGGDLYVGGGSQLLACTTATASTSDSATTSFWADSLRFNSKLAHNQIGSRAVSLLSNLPL